jgi:hypothetical protein
MMKAAVLHSLASLAHRHCRRRRQRLVEKKIYASFALSKQCRLVWCRAATQACASNVRNNVARKSARFAGNLWIK